MLDERLRDGHLPGSLDNQEPAGEQPHDREDADEQYHHHHKGFDEGEARRRTVLPPVSAAMHSCFSYHAQCLPSLREVSNRETQSSQTFP